MASILSICINNRVAVGIDDDRQAFLKLYTPSLYIYILTNEIQQIKSLMHQSDTIYMFQLYGIP